MANKDLSPQAAPKEKGVYVEPEIDQVTLWKGATPEQRNQYIALAVDLILAHPEYAATPPVSRLSRDQLIEQMQEASKAMLQEET
jgi:hypothetical protein